MGVNILSRLISGRTRALAVFFVGLVCLTAPVPGAVALGPNNHAPGLSNTTPADAVSSTTPLSSVNETTVTNTSSETVDTTSSTATPQTTTTTRASGSSPTTTTAPSTATTAADTTTTTTTAGDTTTTAAEETATAKETTTDEDTTTTAESTTTTTADTTTVEETTTGNATDGAANESAANEFAETWIRGTLKSAAGQPLRNDTVYVEDADGNRTRTLTNENGTFAVRVAPNRTYTLVYRQRTRNGSADGGANASVAGPDNVPDVHVVETDLNSPTGVDVGTKSLPTAHGVGIRIRNGSSPVENATLSLRLYGAEQRSEAGVTVEATTNAEGRGEFGAYGTEIEIADSTSIEAVGVRPRTTYERRTVTGNASIDLLVDDEPPTLRTAVLASPVNVSHNATITAANSTDDTGIRLYRWDTPYSHFTTPTPTFTTPYIWSTGTYNVTVTVVDRAGRTSTGVVRIPVVDEIQPTAAVELTDRTPTVGETLTFNASAASDNDQIAAYRWDVDGDGEYDNVTTSPTYRTSYDSIGEQQVTVEVVDGANNSASTTRNVTVYPNATIRASSTEAGIGEQVRFEVARKAPNVTYEWTYNDTRSPGVTVANFTTRTVANVTGNTSYEVILEATSESGLTTTSNETIRIVNYPPNVTVDAPERATAGSKVTLDASGTTDRDADRPLTYDWTQTNGTNVSLANADGATPSFTAPEVLFPTTVNVTVSVTDEHGRTTERLVSVPIKPSPEIEYKPYAYPNETVQFSLSNVADERNAITDYRWRFGDGRESANRSPTHRFGQTGTYPVTLRLNTTRGEQTTVSSPVSVIPRPEIELAETGNVSANTTTTLNASVPANVVGETYTWHVRPGTRTNSSNASNVTRTRVTESPSLTFTTPSNLTSPLTLDVTVEVVDIKAGNDTANTTLTVTPDATRDESTTTDGTGDGDNSGASGGSTGGSSGGSSADSGSSNSGSSSGGSSSSGSSGGGSSNDGSSSGGSVSSSGGSSGGSGGGSSSGGSSSGGNSGSSGSSADGGGQRDAPQSKPSNPEVRVQPGEAGAATVTVRNITHGSEVAIALPDPAGTPSPVAFESIDLVTPPRSSDAVVSEAFELRTRQLESRPSAVAAPPVQTALSYLSVHKDGIDNPAIETATFTFRVGRTVLENRSVDPGAVTLYRYHDGEWSALSTSVVRNASTGVVFQAVSPGFSTFAIGVPHSEQRPNSSTADGTTTATRGTTAAGADDSATERAAARPASASQGEQTGADERPQSADRSGVGISTVYLVALLVTVVCAVLWGYLLQQRD